MPRGAPTQESQTPQSLSGPHSKWRKANSEKRLILPRSRRRRGLRRSLGPIGLREFDSPEMRRRRYKLQAHPLAFSIIVAEVNDAAFLFLLREGIGDG
jgi:hypothetical protein